MAVRPVLVPLVAAIVLAASIGPASARRVVPAGEARHYPIYDPDRRAMTAFHKSLRRTSRGFGQTRILQYGASHTEADLFTGYLRQFYQHRFGDAGHGYVMPARPWRGYRHMDVALDSSDGWFTDKAYRKSGRKDGLHGLAGFSCSSDSKDDWAFVSTSTKSAFGRRVSRFDVAYLQQPGGGRFHILVDGKRHSTISTRAREVGLGTKVVRVADGEHNLKIEVVGDGEVRLLGIVMERGAPGVVMDSLGIRGARASVLLKWNPELWRAQIRRRAPDLVMLAYGTNESGDTKYPIAKYERKLSRVLANLRQAVPTASCLLIGPTDRPVKTRRGAKHRPRIDDVVAVQRRQAVLHGCGFWDAYAAMGGKLSIVRWNRAEPKLAKADFVHLTARGYYALADDLAHALLDGYRPQ
ncbi:MAG: lysophospholipase L1-like esterase [Myxococcota bacterium]|jgi:lysophospholipase L1-like esterase